MHPSGNTGNLKIKRDICSGPFTNWWWNYSCSYYNKYSYSS